MSHLLSFVVLFEKIHRTRSCKGQLICQQLGSAKRSAALCQMSVADGRNVYSVLKIAERERPEIAAACRHFSQDTRAVPAGLCHALPGPLHKLHLIVRSWNASMIDNECVHSIACAFGCEHAPRCRRALEKKQRLAPCTPAQFATSQPPSQHNSGVRATVHTCAHAQLVLVEVHLKLATELHCCRCCICSQHATVHPHIGTTL